MAFWVSLLGTGMEGCRLRIPGYGQAQARQSLTIMLTIGDDDYYEFGYTINCVHAPSGCQYSVIRTIVANARGHRHRQQTQLDSLMFGPQKQKQTDALQKTLT